MSMNLQKVHHSAPAPPFQGWIVEINPVRSTGRDTDGRNTSYAGADHGRPRFIWLASLYR
jgi:hypothetical protein